MLGITRDALVLGMVCRLVEARGCDDFIRIIAMLEPRWQGLLVGGGPMRQALERMAENLGVAGRVRFTGAIDDVRPAYRAMDAYAFLALYEPFGLATAEAMACRVPVFGLKGLGDYGEQGGPLMTEEYADLLWRRPRRRIRFRDQEDPTTLAALSARLNEFGRNTSSMDPAVESAFNNVVQRFSIDRQATAMLGLYHSVSRITN
jgi:glycosyltransferase involved in cell wall biosynthesis